MIRRLRRKFLLAAMLAVALVLLVLIGSINLLNYRSMAAQADETLDILSENDGVFPWQMLREQDRPDDWVQLEGPGPHPDAGWIRPFDERRGGMGELAYQSRYFTVRFFDDGSAPELNLDHLASLGEEEAAALAEGVLQNGRERGFAGDYRFRRVDGEGESLLLFLNCERERETFRSFLLASAGISLAGLLAVFLLLLVFSDRIIRPISESYEKQKRFITDAGHELKTPITIIRADAEVLQAELEDEENEWLADIRKQTDRLAELTEELIYLSKLEEENAAVQTGVFSLSELVEETAHSFQGLALSQGKRFEAEIAPDLTISGDEKAAAKLISILLDNAMKYSPDGGLVSLRLERAGKNARLTVKNDAAPLEKGNADRLFERFARGDRSRNSESGGFGLGLAIAKAVTEAHKGKIHAESEDGASLTVTAELPLA